RARSTPKPPHGPNKISPASLSNKPISPSACEPPILIPLQSHGRHCTESRYALKSTSALLFVRLTCVSIPKGPMTSNSDHRLIIPMHQGLLDSQSEELHF